MSEHYVLIQTRKAVEAAINPKGMSVHDGMVRIPAGHADWLIKEITRLTNENEKLQYLVDHNGASILANECIQKLREENIYVNDMNEMAHARSKNLEAEVKMLRNQLNEAMGRLEDLEGI